MSYTDYRELAGHAPTRPSSSPDCARSRSQEQGPEEKPGAGLRFPAVLPQVLSSVVAGGHITWLGGYPAPLIFGTLCAAVAGIMAMRASCPFSDIQTTALERTVCMTITMRKVCTKMFNFLPTGARATSGSHTVPRKPVGERLSDLLFRGRRRPPRSMDGGRRLTTAPRLRTVTKVVAMVTAGLLVAGTAVPAAHADVGFSVQTLHSGSQACRTDPAVTSLVTSTSLTRAARSGFPRC